MTWTEAIYRSISHNEIVTLDYDARSYNALAAACDDSVDTGELTEFWGRDDGNDWRVHMRTTSRREA